MHNSEHSRILNHVAVYLSLQPSNNYVETTNLLTNEKCVYNLPHGIQDMYSSIYNRDRILLIGKKENEVLLVNLIDGNFVFKNFKENFEDIAFLNSENLIHYKTERNTVVIMSADLSEKILEVKHTGELFQNHTQLDNQYFFCEPEFEKTLQLWDISLVRQVFEITFPDERIIGYEVNQDKKWLVIQTDKVLARVFCLQSQSLVNTIKFPSQVVKFPNR